ncbi:single myb histone 4-like [Euphorbia lathyris]|uniref:single myb histone 4-like n=1 Tax=Euphorbia lathyris TaxID=212925 RepID=UPI003313E4B9
MGNPKQKWTAEEEDALRAGVAKHGTGKWKNIQRDPEFNPFLFARSNIDLKDKWRNMSVSAGGQGPREKSRTPKPKVDSDSSVHALATAVSPIPVSNLQTSTSVTPVKATPVIDDSSKTVVDGKTAPKYNAMIFEAIKVLNEQNGVDTSAIVGYIEQREAVPQNFRRQLSSRLRRLVAQEKLEKVQNCYKIKNNSTLGVIAPTPIPKEVRPRPSPVCINVDTVEEAAIAAAYRIAEAENKSFVAAEAVKEAERVSKMAEDTDSLLQLANEIFEKCSRGEVVLMA